MASTLSSYDIAIELVCGSIGGAVGCAMGHPLDTIKVRLQGSTAHLYTSAIDCARRTLAEVTLYSRVSLQPSSTP
jgi:hypothetical protein